MSKIRINSQAIAEGLGGVMVLKLGNTAPSNAIEIYNKLKTLLDNKETFICLVFDTVTNTYLGDCEAESVEGSVVTLTQIKPHFTTNVKKMSKFVYRFTEDGQYTRTTGSYYLATE